MAFAKMPMGLLANKTISSNGKLLWLFLANKANMNGNAPQRHRNDYLADQTGIPESSIWKLLRDLAEEKWIFQTGTGDKRRITIPMHMMRMIADDPADPGPRQQEEGDSENYENKPSELLRTIGRWDEDDPEAGPMTRANMLTLLNMDPDKCSIFRRQQWNLLLGLVFAPEKNIREGLTANPEETLALQAWLKENLSIDRLAHLRLVKFPKEDLLIGTGLAWYYVNTPYELLSKLVHRRKSWLTFIMGAATEQLDEFEREVVREMIDAIDRTNQPPTYRFIPRERDVPGDAKVKKPHVTGEDYIPKRRPRDWTPGQDAPTRYDHQAMSAAVARFADQDAAMDREWMKKNTRALGTGPAPEPEPTEPTKASWTEEEDGPPEDFKRGKGPRKVGDILDDMYPHLKTDPAETNRATLDRLREAAKGGNNAE